MGTKYSQEYFAKANMTKDLAGLAKLSFKDIKGNTPVSRAELGVMIQNYSDGDKTSTSYKNIYGSTWYSGSLGAFNGSILSPYLLNKTTITQGATRGEVATVFASRLCPGTYTKYLTALDAGTIKDFKFTDIKGYSSSLADDFDNFIIKDVSGYYPAYNEKMKKTSKPPKEVLASLLALHEENVMRGDGQGNSNWTATVTRSEILSLINKERCVVAKLQNNNLT